MTELKSMEDEDFSNTACIVYPAEYPSYMVEPNVARLHSTVLYLGDIDEDMGGRDIEFILSTLAPIECNYYQYVNTIGKDLYGPEQEYPVITLEKSSIMEKVRHDVEFLLGTKGIVSPSQWDYSPHISIDSNTYEFETEPPWVLLTPPVLWYRDEVVQIGSTRRAYQIGRPADSYAIY